MLYYKRVLSINPLISDRMEPLSRGREVAEGRSEGKP
jgi:hypothetical protein